jgi:glycosyltransferase involved in cell wall biosynthesis
MSADEPLVTIAIPTYNRAGTLLRAVESARAQTHRNLEILVCDNASTDDTAEVVAKLARADERIRHVRRPSNVGPVENFNGAVDDARGDYVALLADDDWIDTDYVARCLAVLRADPRVAVAAGRARYLRDGAEVPWGDDVRVTGAAGAERVRAFYAQVGRNAGVFYGLVARETLGRLPRMRNVLGFDWLRLAALAYVGRLEVVSETTLHRELGGASTDTASNLRTSGLPPAQAKIPHLLIAWETLREIGWGAELYAPLGRARRLALAARCAIAIPRREARHVLFHLAPAGLQRRWHHYAARR